MHTYARQFRAVLFGSVALCSAILCFAQEFYVRVVDVSAGECVVVKAPGANADAVPLDSDVIVAPHHGADNGSSKPFIAEVSPEYIVFSSGHDYEHPRKTAAERYLASGVSPQKMFRTDRGDNEGGKEWKSASANGPEDPKGDDDVEIRVFAAGQLTVQYRSN